jgi:serine O-acetyltransferase
MKAVSPLTSLPGGEAQATPFSNCDLAQRLLDSYKTDGMQCHSGRPLPSPPEIAIILDLLRELLLPGSTGAPQPASIVMHSFVESRLADLRVRLVHQLYRGLHHRCSAPHEECPACEARAGEMTALLMNELPELRRRILFDVSAAYDGDPAATGLDEIVFSYPGVRAITVYRIAHSLWGLGGVIVPRMMTELAHAETGIDIHPGAVIGERFFIDHGTGVVIGETTVIGDRVRVYQGVTLGALSLPTGTARKKQGQKRHPTIEDEVIIYANATILGGDTVIGRGAVIGGNAFVTSSVSPGAHVANPCR